MGKGHVELRVHMYHEPVGTRVTRVYECAKWIRLGGSLSGEVRSGKFLSGWKRSLTGRQPSPPATGETVAQVAGRQFLGRYWSIAMISDPRIPAIAIGNMTWKMGLRGGWVGTKKQAKKMPASTVDSSNSGYGPTPGCARARSRQLRPAMISYMSKSAISTYRNRHVGASSHDADLVSPRISLEPENFNQIWC